MAAGLRAAHDVFTFQRFVFFLCDQNFSPGFSKNKFQYTYFSKNIAKSWTKCGSCGYPLTWVKPVNTNLNKNDSIIPVCLVEQLSDKMVEGSHRSSWSSSITPSALVCSPLL